MINQQFVKTKEELIDKVNHLIDQLEDDSSRKSYLVEWKNWYMQHEKEIELCSLKENEFYRANFDMEIYINRPVFSVQLWKRSHMENSILVCSHNIYSSDYDKYDNDSTIHLFE